MNPPLVNYRKKIRSAIILNALVFPGSGQCSIGAKAKGIFFIIMASIFLIIPIYIYIADFSNALYSVESIAKQPFSLAKALDTFRQAWRNGQNVIILSVIALGITWGFAIIDSILDFYQYKSKEKK